MVYDVTSARGQCPTDSKAADRETAQQCPCTAELLLTKTIERKSPSLFLERLTEKKTLKKNV